ncbi:amino acid/polyamine/organocation transporter, apc superfamily [Gigaspora rosea]|uniref:Amino acid/polyamine/organocation transporter, apc superfamily n=1 Tax=Gigaspora rosea TaxID=44941 RepID=A0A397UNZ4_9GLOM|nr:amino acid/polyamine/organocation transporter, apc superfamily [Gigaspora rosea]
MVTEKSIDESIRKSLLKYHFRNLFTKKQIENFDDNSELRRQTFNHKQDLSVWNLIIICIGAIIGNGIFVLTGQAAATISGPAVIISVIFAGITAFLSALSYSELSSMMPFSGSSYTYAYTTLGELIAWIVGWDLALEYLVGAAAVSVGWSGYFKTFFYDAFGIELQSTFTEAPLLFNSTSRTFEIVPGAYFNLPAFAIIIFLTILLVFRIKVSARFAIFFVSVKLIAIFLFIIVAGMHIKSENFHPFIPPNEGSLSKFWGTGILAGTTTVFFAYVGFDLVSTVAEESREPRKNLPLAIMVSFFAVFIIYIAVSIVLVGVVPYTILNSATPLSVAVNAIGIKWLGIIMDIGAVIGLISVILVLLMGQPRIIYAMANDGLFPKIIAKLHPKYGTLYIPTIFGGVFAGIAAALFPINVLSELMSGGTLLAFFVVNILRFKGSKFPGKFKAPGPFWIPLVGAVLNILFLATAAIESIARLFCWMAIGLGFYFFYKAWICIFKRSKSKEPTSTSLNSNNEQSMITLNEI